MEYPGKPEGAALGGSGLSERLGWLNVLESNEHWRLDGYEDSDSTPVTGWSCSSITTPTIDWDPPSSARRS